MCEGGGYSEAVKFAYDAMKAERDELSKELKEGGSKKLFGQVTPVTDAPKDGKKKGLFNTGK